MLEWVENGQIKTVTIADQQPSKHPGTVRLGRDPARCDVVLPHPTVSGLHVEVFFDVQQQGFYLRNLRDTNPPIVNRQKLMSGVALLQQGHSFYLGQVEVKVVAIAPAVPPTVITAPLAIATESPIPPTARPAASASPPTYGLRCPKCNQTSSYEYLRVGCPWCGTSLAAAESVLMLPDE